MKKTLQLMISVNHNNKPVASVSWTFGKEMLDVPAGKKYAIDKFTKLINQWSTIEGSEIQVPGDEKILEEISKKIFKDG